jgi:hypothetical protein
MSQSDYTKVCPDPSIYGKSIPLLVKKPPNRSAPAEKKKCPMKENDLPDTDSIDEEEAKAKPKTRYVNRKNVKIAALGLVVIILITIIFVFVMNTQKKADNMKVKAEDAADKKYREKYSRDDNYTPQYPEYVEQHTNTSIDDRVLNQMMRKKKPMANHELPARGGSSSLDPIPEHIESIVDIEEEKMHARITAALAEEMEESKTATEQLKADEAAAEWALKRHASPADESLENMPPQVDVLCDAVLSSGKREGQICGRQSKDGTGHCHIHRPRAAE